ncbi:hypothetical protein LTR37_010015 [Vermiconidia calcicola]|uniref:Uncharacterized protein n=1 Tax=Vermiconidia calcicola TaxID=1690605 RepID=A0ACC3N8S1_9PEZI|nr:hypothetical protein LTR37_010015 [Vermiconidia calcicola]
MSKDIVPLTKLEHLGDPQRCIKARLHSAAARRIFGLPEILERILANLSVSELYVVMRVDRDFRGLIEDSMRLRRLMFITYYPGPPINSHLNVNPLLETALLNLVFELKTIHTKADMIELKYRQPSKWHGDFDDSRNVQKSKTWRLMKITNYLVPALYIHDKYRSQYKRAAKPAQKTRRNEY